MPKIIDITGRQFGYLTAIEFSHKKIYKHSHSHFWKCKCRCGNYKIVNKQKLLKGETKSCGCYIIEKARLDSTTHGLSKHPLFKRYNDIKNRCYNSNVRHYNIYGGRGVKMCDEWLNDFKSFYNWAIENGWDDKKQIDKDIIPRQKGIPALIYSPEMCSIVSCKENNNNRKSNRYIEYNGEVKTLMQWSEKYGINHGTLLGRLKRGWTMNEALNINTTKTGKRKCTPK